MNVGDNLVKIVPEGGSVSGYTPYFTTQAELEKALESGENLADVFGLPRASESLSYSVFQIQATASTDVFVSVVAPTVEGSIERSGGALQYIIPDRGQWSNPVFLRDI